LLKVLVTKEWTLTIREPVMHAKSLVMLMVQPQEMEAAWMVV